jgi:hypothetical protein
MRSTRHQLKPFSVALQKYFVRYEPKLVFLHIKQWSTVYNERFKYVQWNSSRVRVVMVNG